ncbi:MAG: hypothetical protein RL551_419, partial [Pseudomonadota bacterium]
LHYPNVPVVIDADALNLIADTPEYLDLLMQRNQAYPGMSVLTPHPGEAAHLLNTTSDVVQANRLVALSDLITLTNSIVVLKGQHTLIASPLNAAMQCQQGNPGMAVGGMGALLLLPLKAFAIISIYGKRAVLGFSFMHLQQIAWWPSKLVLLDLLQQRLFWRCGACSINCYKTACHPLAKPFITVVTFTAS